MGIDLSRLFCLLICFWSGSNLWHKFILPAFYFTPFSLSVNVFWLTCTTIEDNLPEMCNNYRSIFFHLALHLGREGHCGPSSLGWIVSLMSSVHDSISAQQPLGGTADMLGGYETVPTHSQNCFIDIIIHNQ